MKKQEAIELLQELLQDSIRLYQANGKADFDAGRVDGIKQAIEKISGGWK